MSPFFVSGSQDGLPPVRRRPLQRTRASAATAHPPQRGCQVKQNFQEFGVGVGEGGISAPLKFLFKLTFLTGYVRSK